MREDACHNGSRANKGQAEASHYGPEFDLPSERFQERLEGGEKRRKGGTLSLVGPRAPMRAIALRASALALVSSQLAGCALTTPEFKTSEKAGSLQEGISESALVGYVKCELGRSVNDALVQDAQDAIRYPTTHAQHDASWLRHWGAQVALKVIVDEKSNLAPSITYTNPLKNSIKHFSNGDVTTKRSFALGASAGIASEATHTELIQFLFYFPDLIKNAKTDGPCKPPGKLFINGDLKIHDFITNKLLVAEDNGLLMPLGDADASPYSAFNYEIQFVVTSSGSISPAWSLARIVTNGGSVQLYSGSRARTDDLLITLGEVKIDKTSKRLELSPAAVQVHSAALTGQASRLQNNQ